MLSTLRKAAKTKVASVIIGALALAFALWGVNDIFRGGVNNVVAHVGDLDITSDQYDRELRGRMRALSQQLNTDLTLEQARAMGLDRTVLNDMISRSALDQAVNRLGLTASDDAVANEIRGTQAFRGPDGAFNPLQFQQTLRDIGLTEPQYIEATRSDMARAQLLGSIADAFVPAPGFTRLFHDIVNETRTPEYVVLTPADAGAVAEPTEAQLAEYHKAHPELFNAPEYRGFDYVEITPDLVADKVAVTEDELQTEYRNQRAAVETPEKRELEQITFPDKAAADAAAARLKSGTTFAALAQERGLKDEDIKLGTVAASALDPQLARVAFSTPEGTVSAPVQGPFGWALLRNVRVVPGVTKSFEEMREPLRANLIKARAIGHMQDLANALEDERAAGASLTDAAAKLKIPVKHVAAVDAKGLTPEGTKAELPASPSFMQQVSMLEEGDESDPFVTEDQHHYVVKMNTVTPVALRPLDRVRAEVRDAWLTQQRADALRKRAQTIAQGARESGLADAVQNLGRRPTIGMPVRRDAQSDVFTPILLQQFFGQPKGGVVSGPAPTGGNYVVARVADIRHPPVDAASQEYAQFRGAVGQQLAEELVQATAAAARDEAGVTTNPDVLQTVLGEAPQ
jgi:peptidyl-prolyl cis-trans isomerase D